MCLFASCQTKITNETVVGIQAYKGFPKAKTDTIAKTIAPFYGVKTVLLPEKELPEAAFTNYKAPRYRENGSLQCFF